jgi:hypothetical protein
MLITGNFTGKPAVNTRYGLGGDDSILCRKNVQLLF